MLKKLLKYDLKSIFKPLIIFYSIIIFLAIFGCFIHRFNSSALTAFLYDFCSGAIPGFAIGAIINNTLNLWRLFHADFYGDHAYLMRTLPVSSKALYLSKFLSVLITIFTTIVIVMFSLMIIYGASDVFTNLEHIITAVPHGLSLIIMIGLLIYLELIFAAQVGTTSSILGHYTTKNHALRSVIIGFTIYLFASAFILLIVFLAGLINPEIMRIFTEDLHTFGSANGLEIFHQISLIAIIVYSTFITITYLLNQKLLARGVDVE